MLKHRIFLAIFFSLLGMGLFFAYRVADICASGEKECKAPTSPTPTPPCTPTPEALVMPIPTIFMVAPIITSTPQIGTAISADNVAGNSGTQTSPTNTPVPPTPVMPVQAPSTGRAR